MSEYDAEARLDELLNDYAPTIAEIARGALHRMREIIPGAVQLVYSNYNALVIGFGPNERASDAILSIALYPRWVNLFFLRGAQLDDPSGLLEGTGKQVRRIRLSSLDLLNRPDVVSLIGQAIAAAPAIPPHQPSHVTIRADVAVKRTRRRS